MDRLRRLEIFVKVADAGSFAKAANLLLVTPSAVSHAVKDLEREFGSVLFYRTTRQLRLSPDGDEVLRHARSVLAAVAQLDGIAGGQRDKVAGTLKLGVPMGVARHILMPALPRFIERYPEVEIQMTGSGAVPDMHVTGADINFRIGPIADSELVAKPLARLKFGVYGAPAYLSRYGAPKHPDELKVHRTLVHKSPRSTTISPWDLWSYERDDERGTVQVWHRFVTDDREALLCAALAGAGLFRIGMFAPTLLSSGQLVSVLSDWRWPGGPELSLLYRRTPNLPRRITAFIAFALEAVRAFDPMQMTLEAVGG